MSRISSLASQAYLRRPNLETFQLTSGSNSPVAVNNCNRRKMTLADLQQAAAQGIELQPTDLIVYLRQAELDAAGASAPQAGNVLKDADNVAYSIEWFVFTPVTNSYRCACRQQVSN